MVVYVIIFILAGLFISLMKVLLKFLYEEIKEDEKMRPRSQLSSSVRYPSGGIDLWLKTMIRRVLPQYFKDFRA